MGIKEMRVPTCVEYDLMEDVAKEDNAIMHRSDIFSWCQDLDPDNSSPRVA